jgi:hypothetical protein
MLGTVLILLFVAITLILTIAYFSVKYFLGSETEEKYLESREKQKQKMLALLKTPEQRNYWIANFDMHTQHQLNQRRNLSTNNMFK